MCWNRFGFMKKRPLFGFGVNRSSIKQKTNSIIQRRLLSIIKVFFFLIQTIEIIINDYAYDNKVLSVIQCDDKRLLNFTVRLVSIAVIIRMRRELNRRVSPTAGPPSSCHPEIVVVYVGSSVNRQPHRFVNVKRLF